MDTVMLSMFAIQHPFNGPFIHCNRITIVWMYEWICDPFVCSLQSNRCFVYSTLGVQCFDCECNLFSVYLSKLNAIKVFNYMT